MSEKVNGKVDPDREPARLRYCVDNISIHISFLQTDQQDNSHVRSRVGRYWIQKVVGVRSILYEIEGVSKGSKIPGRNEDDSLVSKCLARMIAMGIA
jgi:hypothetical protein